MWTFLAAALLLLNLALGLFHSGVSRSKNAASALFRCLAHTCIAILAFWAFGDAVHDGSRSSLFDIPDMARLVDALACAFAANVIGGAMLERSRPMLGVVTSILMGGLLTPLLWRLVSTVTMANWGFTDSGGASCVFLASGIVAAMVAILLGPRLGKFNRDGSTNVIPGHSLPMTSIGLAIIFAAWIAYVSIFGDSEDAPVIAVLAACAATCAAMLFSRFRFGRMDIPFVYTGLLGGLVSITAASDRMNTIGAVVAGVVAGILVPYAAMQLELRCKIDDPAGSIAIFGVGGIWATLAGALLIRQPASEIPRHLLSQLIGIGLIALISLVVSFAVIFLLRTAFGIRSREADEIDGLDLAEHDTNAHPDFQQTTIKSYHTREI